LSRKYKKHKGSNANAANVKNNIFGAFTGSFRPEVMTTTEIKNAPKARILVDNSVIALSMTEFYCLFQNFSIKPKPGPLLRENRVPD
jgi:hypothetical protein